MIPLQTTRSLKLKCNNINAYITVKGAKSQDYDK